MCVDLHTHSHHSDGTHSVAELIRRAAELGLTGFAITDHDTISSQEEAMSLARIHAVPCITGLEVSAVHGQHGLHILALGFDHTDSSFRSWLDRLQEGREERNRTIMEKLRQLGLDVSYAELCRVSHQGQIGRPHIARLLLKKGIVLDQEQAFRRYLGRKKPAWASRFTYSAIETIAVIHQAGGLAVLAHPGLLDPSMRLQSQLVRELAANGLDGIETYHPSHSNRVQGTLIGLAEKNKLVMTGGSDYHDDNRPGTGMAGAGKFCPPDHIMETIYQKLQP